MSGTDTASLFVWADSAQGLVTATSFVSRQDSTAPAVLLRQAVTAQETHAFIMYKKYKRSLLFHIDIYNCFVIFLVAFVFFSMGFIPILGDVLSLNILTLFSEPF